MNKSKLLGLALLGLALAPQAVADDNLWFGVKAGTLGLGVEASWRPVPYLDVRAGANGFTFDANGTESGIDYDGDAELRTLYATANLRVPLSPFRVTAGLFANGNQLTLRSRDAASYQIGGMTYAAADVGSLTAKADFDSVAPYAGVGLDFRIFDTLGLHFDLGVLVQGSPSMSLSADGPLASNAQFLAELEAERQELEREVEDYEYYPVVSVGLSFNF